MGHPLWASVWAVATAKLAFDVALLGVVNERVPESYMDEPFHVNQTQRYCQGRYGEWDPKITTLPGLYVVGTAWARALAAYEGLAGAKLPVDPCGTARLRAVNVALAAACLLALHAILRLQDAPQPAQPQRQQQQQPSSSNSSLLARSWAWLDQPAPALLWAVALAHLPLHWFYTYLYYTDVGSTLFLLLCLLAAAPISTSGGGGTSKGRFAAAALSALSGGMAVLFRQTNAVWVAFVIGAVLVRRTMGDPPAPVATDGSAAGGSGAVPAASSGSSGAAAGPGPAAQEPAAVTTDAQRSRGAGVPVPAVLQELRALLAVLWRERGPLLAELWPLLLVPAGFVVFLVRNGGVTVGDKEAHQPVRHAAQLVYFVLYCLAWLWPVVFWAAPAARSAGARAPGVAVSALLLASGLAAAAVRTAPPPHPYLLADNRHYTFYVWRRLLARAPQALARRGAGAAAAAAAAGVAQQQEGDKIVTLLLPYAAGATTVTLAYLLLRRQRQLWAVGYAACLAMVLVPAWLLEFRYYTAGLLLLALHLPRPSRGAALLVLGTCALVNAATMWLFLFRPFAWGEEPLRQRFMW